MILGGKLELVTGPRVIVLIGGGMMSAVHAERWMGVRESTPPFREERRIISTRKAARHRGRKVRIRIRHLAFAALGAVNKASSSG